MRDIHLFSLCLVGLSFAVARPALAQQADAAEDLANAYALACDTNDAECSSDAVNAVAAAIPNLRTAGKTSTKAAPASQAIAPGQIMASLVRRPIVGNVVDYYVDVRIGPGEHDHIGLHRVVRESAPYIPAVSAKSVMLVHGDAWDFQGAFLAPSNAPADASVAVYLAQQGIDVWGIDLGWTMVSAETTDLSFMANWGFAHDTRDIGIALAIARTTRAVTGSGRGKMNLLGWSRGGQLGYAYLDGESQLPSGLRQVSGFIPVDIYLKTNVEQERLDACSRLAGANATMQSGVYANDTGKNVAPLGMLALFDPTGTTPVPSFQPLSNLDVANLLGAATFLLANPPPVPSYHFTAGSWNQYGMVSDLVYTEATRFHQFVSQAKPYQPWRQIADGEVAACNDASLGNVPFDDHLSSIQNPVLYVGAGGGFGPDGLYNTTLLGSTDITTHVVQFVPSAYRLVDIGHGDIFHATNAQSMFWSTINTWIQAH